MRLWEYSLHDRISILKRTSSHHPVRKPQELSLQQAWKGVITLTNQAGTPIFYFPPPDCEKEICCLSHPFCGILLLQGELRHWCVRWGARGGKRIKVAHWHLGLSTWTNGGVFTEIHILPICRLLESFVHKSEGPYAHLYLQENPSLHVWEDVWWRN